jgi:hypothetical protein
MSSCLVNGAYANGTNQVAATPDSKQLARLKQAGDPATAPQVLTALARLADPAVDECLVLNPNTPPTILKKLFLKNPLGILMNPMLSYQSFTECKSLRDLLSPSLKLALYVALRRASRDIELERILPVSERVQWLKSDGDLCLLQADQMTALWECLAADTSEEVRFELVQRVAADGLGYFVHDASIRVRARLASVTRSDCRVRQWRPANDQPMLKLPTKEKLAADPEEVVRCALASNPELGSIGLEILGGDPSLNVRLALAAALHDGAPHSIWRHLADSSPEVAKAVAANRACPETVLLELCEHFSAEVRAAAWPLVDFRSTEIQQSAIPVVGRMIQDPQREAEVLLLAGNPRLSEPLFERLCGATPQVTQRLASTGGKSYQQLSRLVDHPDEKTAVLALEHIHPCTLPLATRLWNTEKKAFRVALAGLPGLGPSSLRKRMATDPDRDVRLATVQYLQSRVQSHVAPVIHETLRLLAADSEVEIRAAVATDHRLDDETIACLSKDRAWQVRYAILKFHSRKVDSDLGILSEPDVNARREAASTLLAKDWRGNPSVSRKASEQAAQDPDRSVRLLVARSRYSTCDALAFLVEDQDEAMQKALAERPILRSWCKTARLAARINLRTQLPTRLAATSQNPALRALAAGLTGISCRTLQELSADQDWFVRLAVVRNPKTESAIIERLAQDPNPLVREFAQSRINQP